MECGVPTTRSDTKFPLFRSSPERFPRSLILPLCVKWLWARFMVNNASSMHAASAPFYLSCG